MDLRVIGCHGGETPRHRTSAFLVDDQVAIDAGSLTAGMELDEQYRLGACLISHAHMDHVRDLAMLADNRCQAGCEPLVVAANKATIAALKKHFFNDVLWPDFSKIPSAGKPTIRFLELVPERRTAIGNYFVRAVKVNHTIDTSGFLIEGPEASLAYSGDTGPTDRLWELLNEARNLKALLLEVSFPNAEQKFATLSGHHTPRTLHEDLKKLAHPKDLPTLLYHMKPAHQSAIEKECAKLRGVNLTVLNTGDQFVL
ncbi:MAG TPA: 3',5'-cyclic-nucleotide phosphodiesterase [Polyangiaceae bacterium]|nr:3',5'-cyclic-nucleotide phosphodiesterase [Polyangiaceae bacterium]